MKKLFIFLSCILLPLIVFSQSYSWQGNGISSKTKGRVLNVLINIIYDVNPDRDPCVEDTLYWKSAHHEGLNNEAIPTWLLDFMDTAYVSGSLHGVMTRLYGESSFDSLQLTGDFVVANLLESKLLEYYHAFSYGKMITYAFDLMNSLNGLQTVYHHDDLQEYLGNHNQHQLYGTQILIRNITRNYGGLNVGDGISKYQNSSLHLDFANTRYSLLSSTVQCVGGERFYLNPTNIVSHEISHLLFGGNEFHTSGGNHRYPSCTTSFPSIQGGYGLMGAANSSLVGCNGYERWRMHWKHPQSVDYIAAQNIANTHNVVSDISRENGNRSFLLRDFVTYGDAVRIKLPYKDSETSSEQYIWLENHQVGYNDKLDYLQYSNLADCRPDGKAGIYAYYQIGRDVLTGASREVWDEDNRDNLKIIPAEGYYDYALLQDQEYMMNCISYVPHRHTLVRRDANAFCGAQDQQSHFFPSEDERQILLRSEYYPFRVIKDGFDIDSLCLIGDDRDAFSSHTLLNMGTNPSTCNTMTCHSKNDTEDANASVYADKSFLDTRKIYLSGLGIEMIPQQDHNVLVYVRWDDYDIRNDARWTGDIVLQETARLTNGCQITLAQNRSVVQNMRDTLTGLFSTSTSLTCKNGSYFIQDTLSKVVLSENSRMVLENGCHYQLNKGASLVVGVGSTLQVDSLAVLRVLDGAHIIVEKGGCVVLKNKMRFGKRSGVIVHPGGQLIVDGGTLTQDSTDVMWEGVFVEGDRNYPQSVEYQGELILRNATIEHAFNAVTTTSPDDHWSAAGGIIMAENTRFQNNARSVEIISYADRLGNSIRGNRCTFKACNFVVDDNNCFAANDVSFTSHVTLWDVKDVKFQGCNFSSTVSGNTRAIYSEDAGFSVKTLCTAPDNLYVGCECPSAYALHSSFSGFSTAVETNTTGSQYAVVVDEASFRANGTGIVINGSQYAAITRCDFDLDNVPSLVRAATGLRLNACTGFKTEENVFHRSVSLLSSSATGISANNTGSGDNVIYRNTFTNLTKGISVVGYNGSRFGGLKESCNEFVNNEQNVVLTVGATMAAANAPGDCISTLCNDGIVNPADMVRNTMLDTLENLETLRDLYVSVSASTDMLRYEQPEQIDQTLYSQAEVLYQLGENNADVLAGADFRHMTQQENDEYENYLSFNNIKVRNWTTLSGDDIEQLRRIAEKETGRTSEMAKGVLCFFYGNCYETEEIQTRSKKTQNEGYMPIIQNEPTIFSLVFLETFYRNKTSDDYYNGYFGPSSTHYFLMQRDSTVQINGQEYCFVKAQWESEPEPNFNIDIDFMYIREDTLTGRLYRYSVPDSTEFLICDMSLAVGDTFRMPIYNGLDHFPDYYDGQGEELVVDSVYYVDNRKIISFKSNYDYLMISSDIYGGYKFIEGIGPNTGPFGYIPWTGENALPALLCVHYEDSLVYMTSEILGCEQYGAEVPEYPESAMNLYPNPVENMLTISLEGFQEGEYGEVTIANIAGVVLRHISVTGPQLQIPVSNLSQGVYILSYRNKNGRIAKKFVKM